MNLSLILKVTQIVITVVLVALILLQPKGKGLASDIGNAFSMYRSRRGVEKLVFVLTVVLSLLFVANSVAVLLFA